MFKKIVIFITMMLLAANAAAAGDAARGKEKSSTCVACHTEDGNSVNPIWPKLAGQSEEYLKQQLIEFRKGDKGMRNNPVMYGMAVGLSDEDIDDLAAYYASQKISVGEADPALVELGQQIYRGGDIENGVPACSSCHGPRGLGNNLAKFPRLAGQHATYIEQRLQQYKEKTMGNDPDYIMYNVAANLTNEQIKAVSSYVQGLQ